MDPVSDYSMFHGNLRYDVEFLYTLNVSFIYMVSIIVRLHLKKSKTYNFRYQQSTPVPN